MCLSYLLIALVILIHTWKHWFIVALSLWNDLLRIWQTGRRTFDKCITAHSLISMRFDAIAKVQLQYCLLPKGCEVKNVISRNMPLKWRSYSYIYISYQARWTQCVLQKTCLTNETPALSWLAMFQSSALKRNFHFITLEPVCELQNIPILLTVSAVLNMLLL